MSNSVDKDLLIAVMNNRQQQLEKMVKLQTEQLNGYQEQVEVFKVLLAKYEQEAAANVERLSVFVKMLDAQKEENARLKTELQELKHTRIKEQSTKA
jgi:vacuolar-type H+-ATPase subunit I/STV1